MWDPFAHFNRPIPEYLVGLLALEKKSELKKYAKTITITQNDFALLVWNSASLGYLHDLQHFEFQPEQLAIKPGEAQSAFANKEGDHRISPEGRKFINKISQLFKQRRLLTSHIFYKQDKWHLFYFDQRDYSDDEPNHWEHGSHIHFVNFLWPNYDPTNLWQVLKTASGSVGANIHIRFERQKHRES